MLQDGVAYREFVVTGEALHSPCLQGSLIKEETQGVWECEVADELVVVKKFRPEKPGNSVEGKTGMTTGGGPVGLWQPKAGIRREGVK